MLLQQLTNGLMLGSGYSLVAIGFNLVFGVLGLLNFAHGGVFMIGAYVGVVLIVIFKFNIYLAILGSMVVCSVLGLVVELLAFRPIKKEHHLAPLIATIGLTIIIQEAAIKVFGPETIGFPKTVEIQNFNLGPVWISSVQILIFSTSILLMMGLHFFIKLTKVGKAIRATAEDSQTASLLGVSINQITVLTFIISSALAGAGGVLIGLNYNSVHPFIGMNMVLKGFVIILLGGLGNVTGAMFCGLILGMIEVLSVAYLSSSYRDAFAFLTMLLILVIRPSGLFGLRIHER